MTTGSSRHLSTNRTRRRPAAALLALAATVLAAVAALGTSGLASAWENEQQQVQSVPVEFHVTVVNQGLTPCIGDTAPVPAVIRGHITGPANALKQNKAVGAVFTHGDGYDETFNNFPDPQYNVVQDLGKRGHVSVTYDRLGYGDSDKPNGNTVCIGTDATVLHQIVGQLRSGQYRSQVKPAFTRLASFGHSAGGFVAEQEAGKFHDIDALGAVSTGLEAQRPLVTQRALEQQGRCANPATAPNGYAGLEADAAQFRADHIFNVEPRIADILTKNRTKDACAGTRNIPNIAANTAANAAQTVPLLAIAGVNDMFFPNAAAHAATFGASAKKTVVNVPNAGHAIAFARTAPVFRNAVAAFLQENKL